MVLNLPNLWMTQASCWGTTTSAVFIGGFLLVPVREKVAELKLHGIPKGLKGYAR